MSGWFKIPVSDSEIKAYKRKYGKVRRLSEQMEYDQLPSDESTIDQHDEEKTMDTNIDEVVDYDDNDIT